MPNSTAFIVTGDDFGYDSAANHGVILGLCAGYVSHASVMVNMPGFDEALQLAQKEGVAGRVGLHLNLAEGVPLTEPMRKCVRFCADGVFNDPDTRSRFVPLSSGEHRVVADEIRAQLLVVRSRGVACTHLDSHRYVHTMPNLAGLILQVAAASGIRRVRPYQNCGPETLSAKRVGKALYNGWLWSRGLKKVQYFGSIDDLRWRAGRTSARIVSAEIMTHPRLDADGVVVDGSAGPLRERLSELGALLGAGLVARDGPVRYDK